MLCSSPFWQHESYDHWIRNPQQFDKVLRYIEENPVRAGLCPSAVDYLWGHAGTSAGVAS